MSGNTESSHCSDASDPLGRIAELAREVLRSRGLSEAQIDALLRRPRAPDKLRPDDNGR